MPITVACQCGARFAAKDELAGKTVKCPKCQGAIQIPAPVEASGVGSILDEVGLKTDARGLACPKCKNAMQPGTVQCMRCGYNLQTATVAKKPVKEQRLPTNTPNFKKLLQDQDKEEREYALDMGFTPGEKAYLGLCTIVPLAFLVVFSELDNSPLLLLTGAMVVLLPAALFVYASILFVAGRSRAILLLLTAVIAPLVVSTAFVIYKMMRTPSSKGKSKPFIQHVSPAEHRRPPITL